MGTAKIPIASGFTAMSTKRWGEDGIVTARLGSNRSMVLLLGYRKRASKETCNYTLLWLFQVPVPVPTCAVELQDLRCLISGLVVIFT